jgi:hypothetical protein
MLKWKKVKEEKFKIEKNNKSIYHRKTFKIGKNKIQYILEYNNIGDLDTWFLYGPSYQGELYNLWKEKNVKWKDLSEKEAKVIAEKHIVGFIENAIEFKRNNIRG